MSEPEFTIERLDPRLLTAHPGNFRRHPERQRAALAASIAEHGYLAAPIWNRTSGHLLDGHARVELALEREEPSIPVRVIEVGVRQEKRILASFDRIGELRERDDEALAALLAELAEEGELPPGWDDADLAALIEPESGLLPGTDPDAIPEVVETRCQPGDLWKLGAHHRLLCGDSAKREDVERLMGGRRASLMATDPPYLVEYQRGGDPRSFHPDHVVKDWPEYVDPPADEAFYRDFLDAALNGALAEAPAIYIWHVERHYPKLERACEALAILPHCVVIWVKSRPTLTRKAFLQQHEPCLYAWRRGFLPERRPPSDARTVWEVSSEAAGQHPCQKPVELFSRPVEWHTAPSDICYEPFAGSGTQIIAAEQLGRACYAMEISPQFCDVILARWEMLTGQEAERL